MYSKILRFNGTTEHNTSASDLDLFPSIVRDGQLHTSTHDKHDTIQDPNKKVKVSRGVSVLYWNVTCYNFNITNLSVPE